MEKRLTRYDILFTLMFIFLLVAAIGAFFYGVKVGKDKSDLKYEALIHKQKEEASELAAYHQQYLVSFYHNVYAPFREFQAKWFEHMDSVQSGGNSVDPGSLMKELGKLADAKYMAMLDKTFPKTSPLLVEAHDNYLKSLKLFADTAQGYSSSESGDAFLKAIESNGYFQEAKNFSLVAQNNYFDAIVKWNEAETPGLKGLNLLKKNDLSLKEWSSLNLNEKNKYVSGFLAARKFYSPFYPQDAVAQTDKMIISGQAGKMKLSGVSSILDTLIQTGAVRQGDFMKNKDHIYLDETIPQLPFFLGP